MDTILEQLCAELEIRRDYGENIIKLLDEGNTIPFIARYRKELHGEMDDQRLRRFAERLAALRALEERRGEVSRLIEEQGKLSPELSEKIKAAKTMTELDDIYRPYRPKRRTRASIAREKGLAPLAELIMAQEFSGDINAEAEKYVSEEKGVGGADEALAGAKDIIAEEISDNADLRMELRRFTYRNGILKSARGKEENPTFKMYFEFSEPVNRAADHRILALNRGEKEGALSVGIEVDSESACALLCRKVVKNGGTLRELVTESCEDAYKRLIAPSIENEIRNMLTERAETGAISLFGLNLKNLLLVPPVKGHVVLGIDPGYRTGCKLAVVDETGKVLETGVAYFTLEHHDKDRARAQLTRLIEKHGVTLISIGNGTATGESESFVAELIPTLSQNVRYMVVSEAGASVYSASKLAADEFPDYDVSLRSAVSIARRLQDPLSELVKIDPRSIGVGQYQHDCNQKKLGLALSGVVEDCVNSVGVDLNTASAPLLGYVSGINSSVAKNIVDYREQNGRFTSRKQLLKVSKLGNKAFEQSAGFMRISGGSDFLDNTSVHPESYAAARELISLCGYGEDDCQRGAFPDISSRAAALSSRASLAERLGVGEITLNDIISSLQRPGRDPRDELPKPMLRSGCMSLEDLRPGMVIEGTVRNVIDFGAFVDIGVHQDGLVHISQIANRYIKHPTEVLSVGDIVKVKVLSVDPKTKRISLSMKEV